MATIKWDIVEESDAEFSVRATDDNDYLFPTASCSLKIVNDATAISIEGLEMHPIIIPYEDINTPVSTDIYDLVENKLEFMF